MTRPFRVLVVDDETFVRESLREVLAAEGFTVDGASDVKTARARLAKHAYDAVVTDLRMPGESGLALFDETLSNSPLTPILVITGVGTVSDAVAAMKKGAFDFLQKPVDPDELVRRVRRRRASERRAAAGPAARGHRGSGSRGRLMPDADQVPWVPRRCRGSSTSQLTLARRPASARRTPSAPACASLFSLLPFSASTDAYAAS